MALFMLILIFVFLISSLAYGAFTKYHVIPGSLIRNGVSWNEPRHVDGYAECCVLCDRHPECKAVNIWSLVNGNLQCELKGMVSGTDRYETSPGAGVSLFKSLNDINPTAGAIATQHSVFVVGGAASRAIDGITSGNWDDNSCTHTALDNSEHWWMVTFQRAFPVSAIVIWNRDDLYERLRDLSVYVSDHVDALGRSDTLCATYTGPPSYNTDNPTQITCQAPMYGRFLKIVKTTGNEPLTLCEVEILQ